MAHSVASLHASSATGHGSASILWLRSLPMSGGGVKKKKRKERNTSTFYILNICPNFHIPHIGNNLLSIQIQHFHFSHFFFNFGFSQWKQENKRIITTSTTSCRIITNTFAANQNLFSPSAFL